MVRTSLFALTICTLMTVGAIAQEKKEANPAQEKKVTPAARVAKVNAPWFDMDHCPVCKSMTSNKELMEHMNWETFVIDNGMLCVTTFPASEKEAMAKCKKEMEEAIAKVKSGKTEDLCGCCISFGALLEAGAKQKEIETATGCITMLTSDKPEVVKKIQDHAKRTIEEFTALKAGEPKNKK